MNAKSMVDGWLDAASIARQPQTSTMGTTGYTTYHLPYAPSHQLHFAPASEQLSCAVVEPDEPDDEEEAIVSPERLPPATVGPFTLRL